MLPRDSPELAAQSLVAALVIEICPDATLVEFDETPDGAYLFRVEIPGENGKDLRLSKRLLHAALRDRRSLAAVRQLLRSNFLTLKAKRAVSDARAIRAARPSRTTVLLGVVTRVDLRLRTLWVAKTEVRVATAVALDEIVPGMVVTATCQEQDGRMEAIAIRWRRAG